MADTRNDTPLPPAARIYVSSVSALVGVHPKRTANDVLKDIKRQRTQQPAITQMIPSDTYWTLVGMIKDVFEDTKAKHIETIKTFIKEVHPDSWYDKLYESIRGSSIEKSKTLEKYITRDKRIILCGKPDIIEGKTLIDIKKTTSFDGLKEDDKIRIYCYMKIAKLNKAIFREVINTEHKDTLIDWDYAYWKKIHNIIVAFCNFL
jgi:hypothetical protein